MAFLSALSEEEQKIKAAKQERLRAELAEQVQAKREQKRIAKEARLLREQKEYEEEMAARGLVGLTVGDTSMLKQRSGMCTGTLIGDGLILTARHCATNPAGLPLEHAVFRTTSLQPTPSAGPSTRSSSATTQSATSPSSATPARRRRHTRR